jgi:4-amino-4-deoxy-L-arabinose transferase-like glycosyltransferase
MRLSRRQKLLLLLIVAAGAAVRFYGLAWGAPYYHFHIDEHFVFVGALEMRDHFRAAAQSPKFFMYSPLPMYLVIGLKEIYEHVFHPLDLTIREHGVTFMVMGRAISATLGTATIPLAFLIARRVSGNAAGLIAGALTAFGVLHLRDSHFFSVDPSLTFFSVLAWFLMVRMAEKGTIRSYVWAGAAVGAAVLCKYTAVFLLPIALVAHLCAPGRPGRGSPAGVWVAWLLKAAVPGLVAVLVFLALDPLVFLEFDKFRVDFYANVSGPASGAVKAIWMAQFTNVTPLTYWFTNILWWGLGPLFEIWAIAGVAWLLWRRDRLAVMAVAFPICYYIVAGQTTTPYARYGVPFVPALAVTAGAFGGDLLRQARWRTAAIAALTLVIGSTVLYAAAYMNVFIAPDSRLSASAWLQERIPEGSRILVEPSHNIPPMGRYFSNPSFHIDYVMWDRNHERQDYFHLYSLDTYRFLYGRRSDDEKRAYIRARLALVDFIVMDDTFVQFYRELPASEHGAVKEYYDDLFAGRLGFQLVKTFKTYPGIGKWKINDDAAELSFRLFDHPTVFVFARMSGPRRSS